MADTEDKPVAEPEIDNIEDDIRKSFEEVAGEDKDSGLTIDRAPRSRDETGKFSPKAEEALKRETLTLPADKAPKVSDPAAPATATPAEIPYPKGWKQDFKDKWGTLDPNVRAEIVRREEALEKKMFEHDQNRDLGRKITEVATPYLPAIRAEGANIEKAFQDYLQTAHVLRNGTPQQKSMALRAVAQQFSVDLSNPQQQGPVDPQLGALHQQIADLRGQLQGFSQKRESEERSALEGQVEAFKTAPGHEHFESVKELMGVLLESGKAKDLDDAYDRAVHADPTIRTTLSQGQIQAAAEKRLAELNAQTARAKNASSSVTGAPGSYRPLNGGGSVGSIEDDLRAAWSEYEGRA